MLGWGKTQESENRRILKELLKLRGKYGDNDGALCSFGRTSEGVKQEIAWRTKEHKKSIKITITLIALFATPVITTFVLLDMGMAENIAEIISMMLFCVLAGILVRLENIRENKKNVK